VENTITFYFITIRVPWQFFLRFSGFAGRFLEIPYKIDMQGEGRFALFAEESGPFFAKAAQTRFFKGKTVDT